jgi:protein O-GlcNAc transferase
VQSGTVADRVARMELEIERGGRSCSPFVCLLTTTSPRLQRQCAATYIADRCTTRGQSWRPSPCGDTRLHIGYVSSDFHDHATAHLMAGLFELHDRTRFKITALSIGPPADDWMSRRLQRAFGHIEEMHGLSDAQCAKRIAELGIQILIDLKGHTYNARTEIFSLRAAPLQVSYLGYPDTIGGDFVDYLIADAHVVPSLEGVHYSEKMVHLATCYQVNDRLQIIDSIAPSRRECGLPEEGFVFCCFNAVQKLNPDTFASWMRILGRVDGSVLWLLDDNHAASNNLRGAATRHHVSPDRLVFAPRMPHEEHLARYQQADLFLDTLPYNAHTSGSDSLAAGCPLLTILGDTFAGRVGASMLHAVGAPDLITRSRQDYEDRAVSLATHKPLLAELKRRLRASRSTAPLFDTNRTRSELEEAYETMWARHASGLPPESFRIAPPRKQMSEG